MTVLFILVSLWIFRAQPAPFSWSQRNILALFLDLKIVSLNATICSKKSIFFCLRVVAYVVNIPKSYTILYWGFVAFGATIVCMEGSGLGVPWPSFSRWVWATEDGFSVLYLLLIGFYFDRFYKRSGVLGAWNYFCEIQTSSFFLYSVDIFLFCS